MQKSFSEMEYAAKKKQTRRDRFLSEIEAVTPWSALVAALQPHYPRGDGRGRPPIALERMLRMYIARAPRVRARHRRRAHVLVPSSGLERR